MEAVEAAAALGRGNADSVVRALDDRLARSPGQPDHEARRANRVGECVVDEVVHDAAEVVLVSLDKNRIRWNVDDDLATQQRSSRVGSLNRFGDDLAQVDDLTS